MGIRGEYNKNPLEKSKNILVILAIYLDKETYVHKIANKTGLSLDTIRNIIKQEKIKNLLNDEETESKQYNLKSRSLKPNFFSEELVETLKGTLLPGKSEWEQITEEQINQVEEFKELMDFLEGKFRQYVIKMFDMMQKNNDYLKEPNKYTLNFVFSEFIKIFAVKGNTKEFDKKMLDELTKFCKGKTIGSKEIFMDKNDATGLEKEIYTIRDVYGSFVQLCIEFLQNQNKSEITGFLDD